MKGEFDCPGCRARLNEDDRTHGTCWRCGHKFERVADVPMELVEPLALTGTLEHMGYTIHWENYRPAYLAGELRGEWVAESQTGYSAMRLPALVSDTASEQIKAKEKMAALKKLLGLIDGSNS